MSQVYRKGPIELRCGDYRDVLADVEPDAVITDPPYGERTHANQFHGRKDRSRYPAGGVSVRGLGYSHWDAGDVESFWATFGRVHGWVVPLTSHDLVSVYASGAADAGRYQFAPLPCVTVGMSVRLAGDGPSSWSVYAVPSRPRAGFPPWGTLPGAYWGTCSNDRQSRVVAGGKPLWLMRALVRDYSRPGDLVCDPCAGGATTLIAAALEGRRAIGAELDPETFAKACARIERTALTPPLPGLGEPRRKVEQATLGLEDA